MRSCGVDERDIIPSLFILCDSLLCGRVDQLQESFELSFVSQRHARIGGCEGARTGIPLRRWDVRIYMQSSESQEPWSMINSMGLSLQSRAAQVLVKLSVGVVIKHYSGYASECLVRVIYTQSFSDSGIRRHEDHPTRTTCDTNDFNIRYVLSLSQQVQKASRDTNNN